MEALLPPTSLSNADATGSLSSLAQGLSTGVNTESDEFGTVISSDATVQGFANLDTSADASTTAGAADADATGADIAGAQLGDLSIGGIGTITGSANLAAAANAANITGGGAGAANANAQITTVNGLVTLSGDGIDIGSDAGIKALPPSTSPRRLKAQARLALRPQRLQLPTPTPLKVLSSTASPTSVVWAPSPVR